MSQEIGAAYDIAVATLNGDIQRDLMMNFYGKCLKMNKDAEYSVVFLEPIFIKVIFLN